MQPKQSSLAIIIFTLLFGIAISMDISSLINSKLVESDSLNNSNPSHNVTTADKKNSLVIDVIKKHTINSDFDKNEYNTGFSVSKQDTRTQNQVAKPTYPKPTIKLLVFKKHSDRQFYKLPINMTLA